MGREVLHSLWTSFLLLNIAIVVRVILQSKLMPEGLVRWLGNNCFLGLDFWSIVLAWKTSGFVYGQNVSNKSESTKWTVMDHLFAHMATKFFDPVLVIFRLAVLCFPSTI